MDDAIKNAALDYINDNHPHPADLVTLEFFGPDATVEEARFVQNIVTELYT